MKPKEEMSWLNFTKLPNFPNVLLLLTAVHTYKDLSTGWYRKSYFCYIAQAMCDADLKF